MLSQNGEATHEATIHNKRVFVNLNLRNTKTYSKNKIKISCLIETLITVLLVLYNNTILDLTLVLKIKNCKKLIVLGVKVGVDLNDMSKHNGCFLSTIYKNHMYA